MEKATYLLIVFLVGVVCGIFFFALTSPPRPERAVPFPASSILFSGQTFEVLPGDEHDGGYYAFVLVEGEEGVFALRFEDPPPQRGVMTAGGEILPLSTEESAEP